MLRDEEQRKQPQISPGRDVESKEDLVIGLLRPSLILCPSVPLSLRPSVHAHFPQPARSPLPSAFPPPLSHLHSPSLREPEVRDGRPRRCRSGPLSAENEW